MFNRSVRLYCAALILLSIWSNLLWSHRGECDEQRHSPRGSLTRSIISYERCPDMWCVFEALQFEASCCIWRNSWFWTEGWRRRQVISRGHVCLMTLVKVNQTHGLQWMKGGGSHQTRMNNSAPVSEFWEEMTRIYYSVSVSLDRITSQLSP